MFERFSRSWNLVKASASVLKQDKELLVFPLLSSAALVVVTLAFIVPVIGLGTLDAIKSEAQMEVAGYVIAFFFYFSQYFVIFFFNSALVGAAMIRLEGGDPTVRDGLRIAGSKFGVILAYAAIAATVGMILRIIQERVGFIGKIIVALIGVGWNLATYLVVPVLVHEQVGPIQAIKESASLFKKTWGESVIGQAGLGLAFSLIFFAVVLVGAGLIGLAAMTKSIGLVITMVVVTVLAVAITALVQAALAGIYAAALYRYATTGEGSVGFEAQTMKLAFAPK